MLNFNSILLFSENPDDLSEFYAKLFDKKPDWDMGGYKGFKVGECFLNIGPHDEVSGASEDPNRIMFNFETKDFQNEVKRVKKLGADVIKDAYQPGKDDGEEMEDGDMGMDMWIATFADPDGNYFQIVTPMKMQES